jgi:hypothetical protein
VAKAYNPSYSEGRDQENHGSKPARANSSERPNLEKPFTKIGLVEWLKVKALSSSPSTTKREGAETEAQESGVTILVGKCFLDTSNRHSAHTPSH